MTAEPELITIIRGIAELEAETQLTPGEISELNALRIRLSVSWPEVAAAIAHAYVSHASNRTWRQP
jgi:hypothetical protein